MLPFDRERFALSPSQEFTAVMLYAATRSPDAQDYERIQCASNAAFKILSLGNEAGVIAASLCPEHVTRLRALAPANARAFDEMLAAVQKEGLRIPPDTLRKIGWYRERSTLPGGGELHYVAVIAVGHGIVVVPTVVLLTGAQAVVVQAEGMKLCGDDGNNPMPLCADPKGTLSAIAQRLLR